MGIMEKFGKSKELVPDCSVDNDKKEVICRGGFGRKLNQPVIFKKTDDNRFVPVRTGDATESEISALRRHVAGKEIE